MSCLVVSCRGRPTRRARPSSLAVASGMSEKSRSRSGIGLALLAAGRARADDANRLFAIVIPPHRVNDQHDSSRDRAPNPLQPAFPLGVGRIVPLQTIGSAKPSPLPRMGPMFWKLMIAFAVPREHFLYIQEFAALRHYLEHRRVANAGTGRDRQAACPGQSAAGSRPAARSAPACRSPAGSRTIAHHPAAAARHRARATREDGMGLDLLIRNGTVVDGSGAARYRADVGITDGRIAEIGRIRSAADADHRRRRADRRAGVHRRPHPHGRAGGVGPDRELLVLARRHQRDHGQLRLRAGPLPARGARVVSPGA